MKWDNSTPQMDWLEYKLNTAQSAMKKVSYGVIKKVKKINQRSLYSFWRIKFFELIYFVL